MAKPRVVKTKGIKASVLYTSPTPWANGRYLRIWSHGHVERMPKGWKPGDPEPLNSEWPTDTPENRAKYRG